MIRLLYLSFLICGFHQAVGQKYCGYEALREQLSQRNPSFYQHQFAEHNIHPSQGQVAISSRSKIRIPIIVHVVWNEYIENISEEQILSQIEILNQDFNRLNADTVRTPANFSSIAGKMDIEFCLARMDEDGLPASGIIRKQTEIQEIGNSPYRVYYDFAGGSNNWDPLRYLNIWVCNIDNSRQTFGIASGPEVLPEDDDVDGIVIDYRAFGNIGTATFPTDQGRTLTHEMGHYLGLMHTWSGLGCVADDLVEDTPTQLSGYSGCPENNQYSCNSEDMFMNYMDLVNDTCMNLFTSGQMSRMMSVLHGPRNLLLNSGACEFTSVANQEPLSLDLLKISPNPVKIELRVNYLPDNTQILMIHNGLGQLIAKYPYKAGSDTYVIPVSDYYPGNYFITVCTDYGLINRKWIKL